MNNRLKAKLATLPRTPGVYFHKSKDGEVIYVGKAAVLKNRVGQYFQNSRQFDVKTLALVSEIDDVDWIETESEIDALFLESEMVKRYMPRYNVLLRDDKSQSFVRIDMKSVWPTVATTRNPADDGAEYFGPFYNGYALNKALRHLRKVYPYLTKEPKPGQSRLDEDLGLSPKSRDGSESYKANLRKLISYIKGNRRALTNEIERDMKAAASVQDFELAASLRNKLRVMKELQRRVMFGDREFLDISKDRALADLASLLGLARVPRRIEGYDISHMSGQAVVSSMVVFTNGVSDRSQYRKFKVTEKNDDTGNIYQTVFRRLSERNLRSWGKPDLLLIDGGKGQLGAAIKARDDRGLDVPIISIAKREEELLISLNGSKLSAQATSNLITQPPIGVITYQQGDWLIVNLHPGQRNAGSHSRNLRGSDAPSPYTDIIKLFQRIRDESHRFAVSYHSSLKRKNLTKSQLDEVPGVGPASKRALLRSFGSLKAIKQASQSELATVVGPSRAEKLKRYFSDDQ